MARSSFQEAGSLAQEVLDNMLEMGGVVRFRSWEGVVDNFRSERRVSKMEWLVHYVRKLRTFRALHVMDGWVRASMMCLLCWNREMVKKCGEVIFCVSVSLLALAFIDWG